MAVRASGPQSAEDRLIARYFRPLAKHPGAFGLIDDAAYNESLMAMSRGDGLQGQILKQSGKIDQAALERGLRTQIARKLGHLFGKPPTTNYAYYDGQDFLARYGGTETYPVDPLPAVWVGIRTAPSEPHVEATLAKVPVSLATVYNTLNQLTDAGLLRQVSVDGTKTYFDTNVSAHHHFYLENNHELVDIEDPHLVLQKMPEVPEGYEIARIDMVVRLRKKR